MHPVSISTPCKFYNADVYKNAGQNAVAFSGKSDESGNSFSSYFYRLSKEKDEATQTPFIPQMSQIIINPALYSDTQKFSEYFENKLKNMLGERSEADIKADIEEVSKTTGTDEKTVTEVMTRLSEFSGWSTLGSLEKELKNANCGVPYDLFYTTKEASKDNARSSNKGYLTLNDVMSYISENKRQITFDKKAPYTLFVDDFEIEEIKKVKEMMPECYEKLVKNINDGKVKLTIIDGWNAKNAFSDLSQTMFGSAHDLKTATTAIIKEMKLYRQNLDEALNGDTVNNLKTIFGDDVPYQIIKNPDIKENSAKVISQNVSSLYPKAPEIRAVIETLAENTTACFSEDVETTKKVKELLAKYFDETAVCFSQSSISQEMRNKYNEIREINFNYGREGEDIYYVIPSKGKSFELMTYQYAKVNGIRPSQIVYYDGLYPSEKRFDNNTPDLSKKTLVILDDIIGSGASLSGSEFKYDFFSASQFGNSDVIFSALATMQPGYDRLSEKKIFTGRFYDKILPGKICKYNGYTQRNDFEKTKEKQLTEKAIGGCGYFDGWACISMPYMLPDNNSNAAGMLFSFSLKNNNLSSNKCNNLYFRYKDELDMKLKQYQ